VSAYPTSAVDLKEEHLADLVTRVCDDDEPAWHELWLALAPRIATVAGRWRLVGRLAGSLDERLDIVTRVMGKLKEKDGRLLREMGALLARRDGSYRGFLTAIATKTAIDHLREHAEYRGHVKGEDSPWVEQGPLSDSLRDERPDPATQVEAHLLMARARDRLDPRQFEALDRWRKQESFEEIGHAMDLAGGADEAEHLVRAAVKQVRRMVANEGRRTSPPGSGGK
jgi:DNA-directed RNA polymerase specialized sigma24 family protein